METDLTIGLAPDKADWQSSAQFTARRLAANAAVEAGPQDMQLGFAHGALEPEQEATSRSKWRPSNSCSTPISLLMTTLRQLGRHHSGPDPAVCTRAFESRLPLKRLSVSGWSGALMVTTSQTLTMSSTPECQARPPLFLNRLEEAMSIMKTHVEGLQSAEYAKADAAARNRADVRAPDIVGLATQSAMFQPPSPPTGKRE